MKHIIKTALALVLVLAVMLVPMSMTVSAATGDYAEPYQLSTDSVRFYVEVAPEATVYIQASDCNNSTVNVGYATASTYMLQYGRQTIYPNGDADNTASFTMNAASDLFSVYNNGTETIYVYMSLTAGTPVDTTGTMDNPEVVILSDPYGWGLSAYMTKDLEAGNEGYYYTVTAPADGAIDVSASAFDAEYNTIGWMYYVNNVTAGKYGEMHFSDEAEPVYNELVPVKEGDVLVVFVTTYDPADMWNNPAGTVSANFGYYAVGSYSYPATPVLGENDAPIDNGNGYIYRWTATEAGTATVTINSTIPWQYSLSVIPVDTEDYGSYYYGDTHASDDDPVVTSESVEMKAGETLEIMVNTYDPVTWQGPSGTINWTLSFEPAPEDILGDVNADGTLTVDDALMLFAAVNGTVDLTEAEALRGDLNADGSISLYDAVRLFYIADGSIA